LPTAVTEWFGETTTLGYRSQVMPTFVHTIQAIDFF